MYKGPEAGRKKQKLVWLLVWGGVHEVKSGWRCRDTETRLGRPQSMEDLNFMSFVINE